jgi:hypothetical protein
MWMSEMMFWAICRQLRLRQRLGETVVREFRRALDARMSGADE